MTTDTSALEALRERVRKATGPDREIDAMIEQWRTGEEPVMVFLGSYAADDEIQRAGHFDGSDGSYIAPRVTKSIDAALGLVERVLKDQQIEWAVQKDDDGPFSAGLRQHTGSLDVWGTSLVNAPLAILDALLSALIVTGKDTMTDVGGGVG